MDECATLDQIRDDIRKRAQQLRGIWGKLLDLGQRIDQLAFEMAEVEDETRIRRRRRGRRRGRSAAPKAPSVVDIAVEILKERGGPMPCTDLARSIRARGVDSGNNERSLRMSAGKGRRLRMQDDDLITLA
ncbi:MAG: hypothetical protein ACYTHM_13055 [Planctomycetota bacterium]